MNPIVKELQILKRVSSDPYIPYLMADGMFREKQSLLSPDVCSDVEDNEYDWEGWFMSIEPSRLFEGRFTYSPIALHQVTSLVTNPFFNINDQALKYGLI